MTAAPRRIDALAARLRSGHLAEYGHLLHDADPDSTVPTFPDLAKGCRDLDPDLVASLAVGLMDPVVWDDCEPAFVDRPVADVQTGGRL